MNETQRTWFYRAMTILLLVSQFFLWRSNQNLIEIAREHSEAIETLTRAHRLNVETFNQIADESALRRRCPENETCFVPKP